MARYPAGGLKPLPAHIVTEALARTPSDQYVIWDGMACRSQPGSIRSQALGLIDEVWTPVALRVLLMRAARLSGDAGLDPDTVRNAVRMHQSARPAAYLLVRRSPLGDYHAVTDVPHPSAAARRLLAGDVVLGRNGERFGAAAAA